MRRWPASSRTLWIAILVLILLIGGVGWWAWSGRASSSPQHRQQAARDVLNTVHVSATVIGFSLAATSAFADFGVQGGIRLVRVRIVDQLHLELRIEADRDVGFADPPKVCLVGPYAAPDDAGLSDPCWGEPDLGSLVAGALATDGSGHRKLPAGSPIVVDAPLHRGDARCDYPPGEWHIDVAANPLIDGSAAGATDLPRVIVEVPYQGAPVGPLLGIGQTRYCGLADAVYLQQGEPAVPSP